MATSNPSVGTSWTQLVPAGDDFTLGVQANDHAGNHLAVAATDADSEPSVAGHILATPANVINRALIGSGFVWAKSLRDTAITLWLHRWNSDPILFDAGVWDTTATWLYDRTWS
jgi:hypothetical protein